MHLIAAKKINIAAKSQTQVSPSHAGTQYANQVGEQHQWQISFNTKPLRYSEVMELFAFANGCSGRLRAFKYPNPLPPIGAGVGDNCTVRTAANALASSIAITGAPASVLGALKAGDFISFDGHEKVYMVSALTNTNGLGQATIHFSPSLRTSVGAGVQVRSGRDVQFNMALKTDLNSLGLDASRLHQTINLQLEERLH